MTAAGFVQQMKQYRFENVFNPYTDRCERWDLEDAADIRSSNLEAALDAALNAKVDTIWVARDLGYRGGRRTGLALTDEAHLPAFSTLMKTSGTCRATHGAPVAERTAAVVWEIIRGFGKPVFLWNVFPFHPHESGNPLSNRCHTRAERNACRPLLLELIDLLQPTTIIAIGNDAEKGLEDLGVTASRVRHPSYGGKADFVSGLARLYGRALPQPRQAALAI